MILPRLGRIAASVTTPAAHPPLDHLPWETPAPITDQAGAPDLASLLATSAHHPTTASAIAMARHSGAPLAAAAAAVALAALLCRAAYGEGLRAGRRDGSGGGHEDVGGGGRADASPPTKNQKQAEARQISERNENKLIEENVD